MVGCHSLCILIHLNWSIYKHEILPAPFRTVERSCHSFISIFDGFFLEHDITYIFNRNGGIFNRNGGNFNRNGGGGLNLLWFIELITSNGRWVLFENESSSLN